MAEDNNIITSIEINVPFQLLVLTSTVESSYTS